MEGEDNNIRLVFNSESCHETDWKYTMRREMQEIIDRLYLGPYAVAKRNQLESLQAAGITHIVCVRHPQERNFIKPNFESQFKYLVLELCDDETQNLITSLPKVNEFIQSGLETDGRVLVHGLNGNSRSAAVVTGFIMQHCKMTARDAIFHVSRRRFSISMNCGFVRQLEEYEYIYKAQQMYGTTDLSQRESVKRKREEDEQETEMDHS